MFRGFAASAAIVERGVNFVRRALFQDFLHVGSHRASGCKLGCGELWMVVVSVVVTVAVAMVVAAGCLGLWLGLAKSFFHNTFLTPIRGMMS